MNLNAREAAADLPGEVVGAVGEAVGADGKSVFVEMGFDGERSLSKSRVVPRVFCFTAVFDCWLAKWGCRSALPAEIARSASVAIANSRATGYGNDLKSVTPSRLY